MSGIVRMLENQFSRMWKLLSEVIETTPENLWREDLRSLPAPSRLAYHIIETVLFYAGETEKNFPWGKKFSVSWEVATESELPTKEQVNKYSEEVRKKVESIFAEGSDTKFLEPQEIFRYTGETLLDRLIYILKHSYYHLGQINQTIKASENAPTDWY